MSRALINRIYPREGKGERGLTPRINNIETTFSLALISTVTITLSGLSSLLVSTFIITTFVSKFRKDIRILW